MSAQIGIFFGSETGNTERAALAIQEALQGHTAHLFDIAATTVDEINAYPVLLFGLSTWHYGEMQGDWEWMLPKLTQVQWEGKVVALFGCGDQEDYPKHFCDAMRALHEALTPFPCKRIGFWRETDYNYLASKAQLPSGELVGLALDEDRQPEKSLDRIHRWVKQLNAQLAQLKIG